MSDTPAAPPDEAAPTPEPPSMHGCPLTDSHGQTVLHPSRQQYVGVVRALLDEGYEMCVDLTAVDYLLMPQRTVPDGVTAERFEVVVNLLSLTARTRIRLRVQVPADDPSIETLFDLHPGSEAMEREVTIPSIDLTKAMGSPAKSCQLPPSGSRYAASTEPPPIT